MAAMKSSVIGADKYIIEAGALPSDLFILFEGSCSLLTVEKKEKTEEEHGVDVDDDEEAILIKVESREPGVILNVCSRAYTAVVRCDCAQIRPH